MRGRRGSRSRCAPRGWNRYVCVTTAAGSARKTLALAFERHATSKLRRAEDLLALSSYGFRGEALPSIAAAADVECVSRAAGAALGTRIRFRSGRADGVELAGAAVGTVVEVRDLFGRQPARRRFLAAARSERAAIARAVADAALARPEIAFHLEIEGRDAAAHGRRRGRYRG